MMKYARLSFVATVFSIVIVQCLLVACEGISTQEAKITLESLGVVIPEQTCPKALQQAALLYETNHEQLQEKSTEVVRKTMQYRVDDFSTGC